MSESKQDDLREALSEAVIDADHAWNGNVSEYRKHLVDSLLPLFERQRTAPAGGSRLRRRRRTAGFGSTPPLTKACRRS